MPPMYTYSHTHTRTTVESLSHLGEKAICRPFQPQSARCGSVRNRTSLIFMHIYVQLCLVLNIKNGLALMQAAHELYTNAYIW